MPLRSVLSWSWFGLSCDEVDEVGLSSKLKMSCSDPVLTDLEVLLEVGEGTIGFGEIDMGLRNVRMRAPVSVMLVSDIDLDRAEISTLLWSIWSIA